MCTRGDVKRKAAPLSSSLGTAQKVPSTGRLLIETHLFLIAQVSCTCVVLNKVQVANDACTLCALSCSSVVCMCGTRCFAIPRVLVHMWYVQVRVMHSAPACVSQKNRVALARARQSMVPETLTGQRMREQPADAGPEGTCWLVYRTRRAAGRSTHSNLTGSMAGKMISQERGSCWDLSPWKDCLAGRMRTGNGLARGLVSQHGGREGGGRDTDGNERSQKLRGRGYRSGQQC